MANQEIVRFDISMQIVTSLHMLYSFQLNIKIWLTDYIATMQVVFSENRFLQ